MKWREPLTPPIRPSRRADGWRHPAPPHRGCDHSRDRPHPRLHRLFRASHRGGLRMGWIFIVLGLLIRTPTTVMTAGFTFILPHGLCLKYHGRARDDAGPAQGFRRGESGVADDQRQSRPDGGQCDALAMSCWHWPSQPRSRSSWHPLRFGSTGGVTDRAISRAPEEGGKCSRCPHDLTCDAGKPYIAVTILGRSSSVG